MKTKTAMLTMGMLMVGMSAVAQATAPEARVFRFDNGAWVSALSDNGKWAIYSQYQSENTMFMEKPRLIDLSKPGTSGVIEICAEKPLPDAARVDDVSDEGLCVGSVVLPSGFREDPAYWTQTGGWTVLPYPEGEWEGGLVSSVTPDGTRAAGKVYADGGMLEFPVLWDLTKNEIIETSGTPSYNLAGEDLSMMRFISISSDGNLILGVVDFSYPGYNYTFLYNVKENTYKAIGYDHVADSKEFTALNPLLGMCDGGKFSPNGKYVIVDAYMYIDNEVYCPLLYDVEDDSYTWYTDEESLDLMTFAVSNEGVVYAGGPYGSPIRTWNVRSGNYWVSFDQILRQKFNTTVNRLTGYDDVVSGSIMGVSADGLTIASLIYDQTNESYVATLPAPAYELAADINLLAEYTPTPRAGVAISSLSSMSVMFSRPVDVVGNRDAITIEDEEGNVVRSSIKIEVSNISDRTIEIAFRNPQFEGGKKYYVVIPEGTLCVKGDKERPNSEIRIMYAGRNAGAVSVIDVTPAEGNSLAELNMSSSPVSLLFDTSIQVTENAAGAMYELYEDEEELVSALGMTCVNNQLIIYPQTAQHLYKDHKYKLVLEAGSVTDIMGQNPNEQFSVTYEGIYEPEISTSYKNDFNDESWLTDFMFYEGDKNEPTVEMQGWGFENGEQYPWWITRDNEGDINWALTSHSMYSPAGKSDDWAILKQKYIADDQYPTTLIFKAQSYRKAATDMLKVMVLVNDNPVEYATDSFIKQFRNDGVVVFNEQLTPGANEGTLTGEFTEYLVSLEEFKGKYIYIAFVNENNNQSAIFIDDVELRHDVDLTVSIDNLTSVVAVDDVTVQGRVRIENPGATYPELTLTLLNSNREEVDRVEYKGEPLKVGDVYYYSFNKPLELVKGATNVFYVQVKGGESQSETKGCIDNLFFKPVKRVVLEEQTGQGCSHCPLGHLAIERMREAFGDRIIPLALHTYTGDAMGKGLEGYTNYLNLGSAAPIATVNRDGKTYSPMQQLPTGYTFTVPENPLWWDAVVAELDGSTVLDINFNYTDGEGNETPDAVFYDKENDIIHFPAKVTFALNANDVNYSVFSVLVENKVAGKQTNGHYSETDPMLGEWGQGGKYGRPNVTYLFDDVVRGFAGNTFNGTPGIISKNVAAGIPYHANMYMNVPDNVINLDNCVGVTMVTDGLTGKVINAVAAPLVSRDLSGVESIAPDKVEVDAFMEAGNIVVVGNTSAEVKAYSTDGTLIAAGNGNGTFRLPIGGYRGVVIVNVVSEGKTGTIKLIAR